MSPETTDSSRVSATPIRWLFLAFALRALLPDAIQYLQAGRPDVLSTVAIALTPRVRLASLSESVLDLAVAGMALIVLVNALMRGPLVFRLRVWKWVMLLCASAFVSSVVVEHHIGRPILIIGIVLFAFGTSQITIATVSRCLLWTAGIVCVASLLLAVLKPHLALVASTDTGRVTLAAGNRLAGITSHPNALGFLAVTGAVCAWTTVHGLGRYGLFVMFSLTTAATGSRTALLALGMAAISFIPLKGRSRVWLVTLPGLVALAVSSSPVVLKSDLSQSVGRTQIWTLVRGLWPQSPGFGHGPRAWSRMALLSDDFPIFAFHAHNQWLDTLFTLGATGGLLLVIMVAMQVVRARQLVVVGDTFAMGMITVLAVEFWTEVPIQFSLIDLRTMIFTLALLALGRDRPDREKALGGIKIGSTSSAYGYHAGLQRRPVDISHR